jgi:hypothetical protein
MRELGRRGGLKRPETELRKAVKQDEDIRIQAQGVIRRGLAGDESVTKTMVDAARSVFSFRAAPAPERSRELGNTTVRSSTATGRPLFLTSALPCASATPPATPSSSPRAARSWLPLRGCPGQGFAGVPFRCMTTSGRIGLPSPGKPPNGCAWVPWSARALPQRQGRCRVFRGSPVPARRCSVLLGESRRQAVA